MKQLVVIALKRPYTFVVLAILIVLFGTLTIQEMPTDVFPSIRIPVTSVVWPYLGMLPPRLDGRITYMFERFVTSTVEGIKYLHSHSYYGISITNIFLQDGIDVGRAEADITAIAQTVIKVLPPDISPAMVMRLAPSSLPVATLEVSSDTMTPAELFNVSYMQIRPLLVTVNGVIVPFPYGGSPLQVMINLDQQALLARHITVADVHRIFREQYLILPAGDVKIKQTDWMILTNASPMQITDFENIPIKREGNSFVYLRDIGTAELMGRVQQNMVIVNGKQSVIIVVMKSTEASTLDVVAGIKEMLPRIQKIIPEGMQIRLLTDTSTFVKDSIVDVLHEMLTAGLLVGAIVLLLLGSWRPTVIIATSIPLSILTAIIGLHWLGETINVMTLGGLALSVGILVDDATVMIENIDRHLEMNKSLEGAIIDAANEIVVPTLVSTLAIAIVWLPLFKLTGTSGFLFAPMAEAVVIAMIASFILSFTLVPTMAKYMLVVEHHEVSPGHQKPQLGWRANLGGLLNFFTRFQGGFERRFNRFREGYGELLEQAVARRRGFVIMALTLAVSSLSLYYFLGRDYFPEIRSDVIQMHFRAPLGTRIEVSARIASLVAEDIERLLPGQVENVVSNCGIPIGPHNLAFIPTPTIGSQDCDVTILLKDEKAPVWEYRTLLRKGLVERYPGTEFTFQPSDLTAKILNFGAPAPIDVQVNGPESYANYEFARKLISRLRRIPGASDVVLQQPMRQPTLLAEGRRTYGLDANKTEGDITVNLQMVAAGSQQVDQIFWLDPATGFSYQINVYIPQPQVNGMTALKTVPVGSLDSKSAGDMQLLGNMANFKPIGTPSIVTHGNIMPLFDLYVSPEGRDLGGLLKDVEEAISELNDELPQSAEIQIHGQAALMHDAYAELIFGLFAAMVLVYLLIVVNFQSWLDPFIIVTALPGALAGIAWALFVTRTPLSEPALTGAIMCMGTATANSILVVSFARDRIREHGDAVRAAIEAGTARFRAVLMTASAMILGMVPMATGYSQNAPLGRAVIGGLLVATVFTLTFVPCVYAMIYSRRAARQQASAS